MLAKAEIIGMVKKIEEMDKRIIKLEIILAQTQFLEKNEMCNKNRESDKKLWRFYRC